MADNLVSNPGAGGATLATDDIGGIHYPRSKLVWGTDGTATDASASNPLPVVQTGALSPGTAGTNLGKAEDVAAANSDVGVAFLTKREDAIAAAVSNDGDYQFAKSDGVGRLYVNGSGVTQPVSGTVTANAGTNLNTSALALEAGGNLAGAATSLAIIDDWDETDRAKVNPIVGQAGVQGGSGAVSALTQRVVLATDVALPAGTNAIGKLAANSGVDIGDVDVTSSALPTGASTSANQSMIITSLQLIDDAVFAEDVAAQAADKGIALLAVRRDADTSLVDTTGDYANLQVNAAGSLKVAITAGAGSGGTSIADGASFTRDTTSITPAGAAVETSAPTLTNGDVAALSMTTAGALRVAVASGGVAGFVDDAVFTPGTTEGLVLMAHADETSPDSVDEGDAGALRMTLTRALHVNLRDAAGAELAVGGGTQYTEDAAAAANPVGNALNLVRNDARSGSLVTTDGDNIAARGTNNGELYVKHVDSVIVTNAGTFAVQAAIAVGTSGPAKAEDVASADGDVGMAAMAIRKATPANTSGTDGDYEALQMSAGRLWVDPSGVTLTVASHAVTNAGTFATQVDGNALTALQLIDDPVFADDAAYTLSTSKVNVIGGIAVETDGTDPTTVSAEGDAAAVRTDRSRRLLVSEDHPRLWDVSADYASAQTNTSVKATPGAGLSLYITDICISNGATAGNITLLDGSGGTVKFEIYPAINGGVALSRKNPIKLTANTALCITSTTVTTHSVNIGGYIAP